MPWLSPHLDKNTHTDTQTDRLQFYIYIWALARARHLFPLPLPWQIPVYKNMIWNNIRFYLLVAHSATQYKGLCVCLCVCLSVCLSVPPFQIRCFGFTNGSFEFLMTSIGIHMIIKAFISFQNLLWVSNSLKDLIKRPMRNDLPIIGLVSCA